MNRQQRRRQAAIRRQNRFVNDYVHNLPEVGPEILGTPGINHMVVYHDERCPIYDGRACRCQPAIRFFAEPQRA